MAQNITLLGANYSAVPGVQLPKTGGGTALFTDVTPTTATAADVASGKVFFNATGTQTIGTNSGGDGSDSLIVTLSWDDDYFGQDDGAWVPDCTINELQDAYTGGKTIVFIGENGESAHWFFDDDYAYIYSILVGGNRPNEMISKGYLFNAQGIESLEDEILIYPNFISPTRTYTPTESVQTETITYDANYDNGIEQVSVTVNAISSTYVGSGIIRRDNSDLYVAGNEVLVPSGYYADSGATFVPTGTEGTPTATKGTVSGNTVTVTPSVTNTAGYISGGTHTGTGVSVSASELVSGSQTITSNQTVDVTNLAEVVVNVSGGGGASNIVMGEFTTPSSAGATNINIPYTGTGHPIAAMVYVKGGAYNNTSSGDSDWYSSVQRYAVGQWTMHKAVQDSNPTYTTSGTQNQGVTTAIYKNSTSTATSYTRTSAMNTNVFSSSNASNSAVNSVKLKSGNVLSFYTNTSSYGLLPNTTYSYIIIYSE